MKEDKLTTKEEIFNLVTKECLYAAQVAKILNVSEKTVSKYITRLLGEQRIEQRPRLTIYKNYKVRSDKTEEVRLGKVTSSEPMVSHAINHNKPSLADEASPAYRNHATYTEYPLESYNKIQLRSLCDDKGINFKEWAIRNNYPLSLFREDGHELRLYNKCIVIVPPDKLLAQDSSLPFNITQYVLRMGWRIARQTEALYGLKIRQIGGFYVGALVRQELAQTNNPMAKDILDKKKSGEIHIKESTFKIIDPDTDRKCFEFDNSPGEWLKTLKEAEATDPANADNHTTTVHMMLDDILHHDAWALQKARIEASEKRLEKIELLMINYGEKLSAHIPYFESNEKVQNLMLESLKALLDRMDKLEKGS